MTILTRQEVEMCQMAVAIITDTRDLTDENKAKWDMLWEKLEVMQKEAAAQHALAPDSPYACLHCGAHISSDHLPWCKSLPQNSVGKTTVDEKQ